MISYRNSNNNNMKHNFCTWCPENLTEIVRTIGLWLFAPIGLLHWINLLQIGFVFHGPQCSVQTVKSRQCFDKCVSTIYLRLPGLFTFDCLHQSVPGDRSIWLCPHNIDLLFWPICSENLSHVVWKICLWLSATTGLWHSINLFQIVFFFFRPQCLVHTV